jgi:adenine phosphoribosyltransferase
MDHLKSKIREVPDFPKPGILFYDITTLLCDSQGFRDTVDALAAPYMGEDIDQVIGIESRGFILGAAVAATLGCGFVPIRKPGKLPALTHRETYNLE